MKNVTIAIQNLHELNDIFARPIACQGNIFMGHEDVKRDANGFLILDPEDEPSFISECIKKHSGCPHKQQRIEFCMDFIRTHLPFLDFQALEDNFLVNDDHQDKLVKIDEDVRLARTGVFDDNNLNLDVIPDLQTAAKNAAPYERLWQSLMDDAYEPRRKIMLAWIDRTLTDMKNKLERAQVILRRTLDCPSGSPLGHEGVQRGSDSLPILTLKKGTDDEPLIINGNEYFGPTFINECKNQHFGCPHLLVKQLCSDKEIARVLTMYEVEYPGSLLRDELLSASKDLAVIDTEANVARCGPTTVDSETGLSFLQNVPDSETANTQAAPIEEMFTKFLAEVMEPKRIVLLAFVDEMLAAVTAA